jgi:hypothetical protein
MNPEGLPVDSTSDVEARWRVIRERILKIAPFLWSQGSICRKADRGGPVWRLRYYERLPDGRLVQRTIRIGCDPVLVERARDLLKRCRDRQTRLEEIPTLASIVTSATVVGRQMAGA